MPRVSERRVRKFPHEETWLRAFVEFEGTENSIRFSDDDLGGVSLVRVLQALMLGSVISAEKCDDPGTICVVFYSSEEDISIFAKVHFISNEYVLTILSAHEARGVGYGPLKSA